MRIDPIERPVEQPGAPSIWRARICLVSALLLAGACSPAPEIAIENPRVRALIPGQDKTVAYMDVHNRTPSAITLTGASADSVRAIEIHTTRMDGGVMRMRRLKEVVIPAGETVRFEPGGRHLMLFGVNSLDPALKVQLEFLDGSVQEVTYAQIAPGAQ
jgi:copper(I)-binding protein